MVQRHKSDILKNDRVIILVMLGKFTLLSEILQNLMLILVQIVVEQRVKLSF